MRKQSLSYQDNKINLFAIMRKQSMLYRVNELKSCYHEITVH